MVLNIGYVYAIKCPFSGLVVYVGKTKNIESRFKSHLTSKTRIGKWIRAIKTLGKQPIIEIIDSTSGNLEILESNYISHYTSLGQACHNYKGNINLNTTKPIKNQYKITDSNHSRREYVRNAYINKPFDLATTCLVNALAKKFNVTTVCIYSDIKLTKKTA